MQTRNPLLIIGGGLATIAVFILFSLAGITVFKIMGNNAFYKEALPINKTTGAWINVAIFIITGTYLAKLTIELSGLRKFITLSLILIGLTLIVLDRPEGLNPFMGAALFVVGVVGYSNLGFNAFSTALKQLGRS